MEVFAENKNAPVPTQIELGKSLAFVDHSALTFNSVQGLVSDSRAEIRRDIEGAEQDLQVRLHG